MAGGGSLRRSTVQVRILPGAPAFALAGYGWQAVPTRAMAARRSFSESGLVLHLLAQIDSRQRKSLCMAEWAVTRRSHRVRRDRGRMRLLMLLLLIFVGLAWYAYHHREVTWRLIS